MKKKMLIAAVIVGICFNACTNPKTQSSTAHGADSTAAKIKNGMKNLVSIVEVPTTDLPRAIAFYQAILDIKIETTEMEGVKMGLFPSSGDGVFVQLINGSAYKPSADGTTVYLNGGKDLQQVLDKIKVNGGQIIVPKTEIGSEMGYFAIFIDPEGNKLGLHSEE